MEEEVMRTLVELANQNMALMDGTTGPIKRLFEEGEIVVGVWQDTEERYGIGYLVLKGARLLQEVVASGENATARVTAIPCECYEQPVAAKQTFGTRDYDA